MKIGIDASRYRHAEATGVEWYSWHIINGLIKSVVGSEDELILYSKEKIETDGKSGAKITNKILPGLKLWTLLSLSKEMRLYPPKVLFVPSHTLPLNLPQRSIITIHDVAFRHLPKVYSFSEFHYLNWSTKFAVKKATRIIVPSEATAEDLIKHFGCQKNKVVVIPHGFAEPRIVDCEKVRKESVIFKYFGIGENDPYILFVGRLETKKNLPKLIEAFVKFLDKNPNYRLILAGKRGVGFEKIVKIVNSLSLAHKVIMPGYVTEEEKFVLYRYCKLVAFPSLYEGFGLPILEAFYHGKAVLCSNSSSLPEVGGEAVHYVNPVLVEEMADGLEKLVKDGEYVENLVAKGRARLKLFSWDEAVKKTLWTIRQ